MNLNINHISVSMIGQLDSCPACWVRKYIYKQQQPPYQPFIDGKQWHENVDNYHTGGEYDQELIKSYTEKYPQDYRILSEVKFTTVLKWKQWTCPLPLFGILDGETMDGLCDLKYAQNKPDVRRNLQSIIYSWVYYMKYKKFPLFTFNWVNKKNGKIKDIEVTHTKEDIDWAVTKIQNFLEAIQQPICVIESLPGHSYGNFHFDDCPNLKTEV